MPLHDAQRPRTLLVRKLARPLLQALLQKARIPRVREQLGMGVRGQAATLVPLQACHADAEDAREHPLREAVPSSQSYDLLGQHHPHLLLVRAVQLVEPLVHEGCPPDGLPTLQADEVLYVSFDHDAAHLFGVMPCLIGGVDLLPAFRAKHMFGARHVSKPFDMDGKEGVPPRGKKRRSTAPSPALHALRT